MTGDRAESGPKSTYRGLGYWHALPWLWDIGVNAHMTVEAGERSQAGGEQVQSWRGLPQQEHGGGGQPLGSGLASDTSAAAEAWAGC